MITKYQVHAELAAEILAAQRHLEQATQLLNATCRAALASVGTTGTIVQLDPETFTIHVQTPDPVPAPEQNGAHPPVDLRDRLPKAPSRSARSRKP